MIRFVATKILILTALFATITAASLRPAQASSVGGATANGFFTLSNGISAFVSVTVADYGPLALTRYAGTITIRTPTAVIGGRPINVVYLDANHAAVQYFGIYNGGSGNIFFIGNITISVDNPVAYTGSVGALSGLAQIPQPGIMPLDGKVWVSPVF